MMSMVNVQKHCLRNSSADYNIRDLPTALDRMKLAGAFFFTLPGPKMLWQFGELGYGYGDYGEQCLNDVSHCPSFAPGRTASSPSDGIIETTLNATHSMKLGLTS